jgi:hypothetical protein
MLSEQFTLISFFIYAVIIFTEATVSVASMEATPLYA